MYGYACWVMQWFHEGLHVTRRRRLVHDKQAGTRHYRDDSSTLFIWRASVRNDIQYPPPNNTMSDILNTTAQSEEEPVYFWKPEQEYGWASQWYHAPFALRLTLPDGEEREALFPTAEHWMMGQKALLFGDQAIFERIVPPGVPANPAPHTAPSASLSMEEPTPTAHGGPARRTRSHAAATTPVVPERVAGKARSTHARKPRYPSAKEAKALGRKVRPFDDAVWVAARERIVLEGTLHKFSQHPELARALLATGERELVEASPMDRIWGVGFGRARAGHVSRDAWGLNLLGKALMEARTVLRAAAVVS